LREGQEGITQGHVGPGVSIGHVSGSIVNSIIAGGNVIIHRLLGGASENAQKLARTKNMLGRRVRDHWITSVLAPRLIGQEFIPLPLMNRPELLRVALPGLAAGQQCGVTGTVDANAALQALAAPDAPQQLLVLGEPGAGKTMFLLEMARQGLAAFHADPEQELPVVVGLAGWLPPEPKKDASKHVNGDKGSASLLDEPFARWLQGEIARLYRVPADAVGALLEAGSLTLLLDGLDELPEHQRAPCAGALEECCASYLGRVVLSCRLDDYERMPHRLVMDAAVQLRPLDTGQVRDLISRHAGQELALAATGHAELSKLFRNPLMLSVLLALEGSGRAALLLRGASPQVLFEAHLDLACERRRMLAPNERKSLLLALGAMARQMQKGNWAAVYPSDLSAQWFTRHWQRIVALSMAGIGLLLGLAFIAAWTNLFGGWSYATFLRWTVFLVASLIFGSSYLVGAGVIGDTDSAFIDRLGWRWVGAAQGLLLGLAGAVVLALAQVVGVLTAVLLPLPLLHSALGGSGWWMVGVYGGIVVAVVLSHLFWIEFEDLMRAIFGPLIIGSLALLAADWLAHGSNEIPLTVTYAALKLTALQLVVKGPVEAFQSGAWWFLARAILLTLAFSSVLFALVGTLVGGIKLHELERKKQRSNEVRRQFKFGLLLAAATFATVLALLYALQAAAGREPDGLGTLVKLPVYLAAVVFCIFGGLRGIAHVLIRGLLVLGGSLPFRFTGLLNKAAHAGLIMRAGGGWMFIHRMQQDHFAQRLDAT